MSAEVNSLDGETSFTKIRTGMALEPYILRYLFLFIRPGEATALLESNWSNSPLTHYFIKLTGSTKSIIVQILRS